MYRTWRTHSNSNWHAPTVSHNTRLSSVKSFISKKKTQIDSFKNHIEASIKLNIPLIVHSRNAEVETFDLLSEFKNSNLKI